MITCTSCGNMVNEGDKFCQYCGTLVVQAAPAPVAAGVCSNCNAALEEGDKFCQICGTPVFAAAPVVVAPVAEEAPVVEEAPVAEAPVVVEAAPVKACANCGSELEDGDKFCQICGTPVAASAPVVEATPVVVPVFEDAVVEEEPVIEEPVVEEVAEEVIDEAVEEAIEEPVEEVVEEAIEEAEEVVEEPVADDVICEELAPEVLVLEIEEEDVPEAEEECECECVCECTVEVEPMGYDFPYLLRRKTRQVIDVNKAFFRIGSEGSVNNYVLEGLGGMHAMLMTTAGKYYIVDLGTEGKTFVNGVEITPDTEVELAAGCALRLADEDFVFIV